MTSTTLSTGHTLTIDTDALTATIAGPTETMDSVPESEIDAACAAEGLTCTYVALDETSYRLTATEPDRLEETLRGAAEALDAERRQPVDAPAGYFEGTITLRTALARVTVETLGALCGPRDVVAYREALTRAWPTGREALSDDELATLENAVFEGRAGADAEGNYWVAVADSRA